MEGETPAEDGREILAMIPDAVPASVVLTALIELEDGEVSIASQILSDALEPPQVIRCHCDVCGQGFEWPGLLDTHKMLAWGVACGLVCEPLEDVA